MYTWKLTASSSSSSDGQSQSSSVGSTAPVTTWTLYNKYIERILKFCIPFWFYDVFSVTDSPFC